MKKENRFFVYVFCDPFCKGFFKYGEYEFEYEPFYVGKGSGRRIEKHFNSYIKHSDEQTYKYRKIRNILSKGENPIIKKIIENVSEDIAFAIEVDSIKKIGRYNFGGPLTNHSDGGEGCSGRICSEETRKKISESLKKCGRIYNPHTDEYKEHMRNIMKGRISPMKNKKQTKEAKENISKNNPNIRCVIQMSKNGNFIREWKSIVEASKILNINNSSISGCCRNRTKSAGGYSWKYKNNL